MTKVIVVDIEKCMGCKSCEIACAVEHSSTKDLLSMVRSGEKPGYRIHVADYKCKAVPVTCNHCEEAACMLACPTDAIYRDKDKGPVLFNADSCIGCKICVKACPFGAITMHSEGEGILKCDLCIDRLSKGQDPACVVSCMTGALIFADEEEAVREKRLKVAKQMVTAQQEQKEESEKKVK